eukprot:TRINITY_DN17631_c0_g1_i1.p1 TRINITY_DN17631_c0_g1~~TRINITY_DN17631_c0_g1_i1.p1  ORF type:complete len:1005 (+),score=134.83 TRINITY_DN17631_c0_g1_i1:71-3016(+)
MSALVGGVAGAYVYNMQKFKFDATQHQKTVHQEMNLRIAQWKMFREDVRDLFRLFTEALHHYMVVGMLTYSISIFAMHHGAVLSFPHLLQAGNTMSFPLICTLAGIGFAILSTWLSMYGALASHSWSNKLLTQAIRVPIPTLAELEAAEANLALYEQDPSQYLRVPVVGTDLTGVMGSGSLQRREEVPTASVPASSRDSGSVFCMREYEVDGLASRTFSASASCREHLCGSIGAGALSPEASPPPCRKTHIGAGALSPEASPHLCRKTHIGALQEELKLDKDHWKDEEYGGPGRDAAFDSHTRLCRQVHQDIAAYDAYSRIALSLATQEFLLAASYFAITFEIINIDTDSGLPYANIFCGWSFAAPITITCLLMSELELDVSDFELRRLQIITTAPICIFFVAQSLVVLNLLETGTLNIIGLAVAFGVAHLLHVARNLLLMRMSYPSHEEFLIPLSWRAVTYFDIFGWMNTDDSCCRLTRARKNEPISATCHRAAQTQCRRLLRQLKELKGLCQKSKKNPIQSDDVAKLFSMRDELNDIRIALDSLRQPEMSQVRAHGFRTPWLACEFQDSAGEEHTYYLHIGTGVALPTRPDPCEMVCFRDWEFMVTKFKRMLEPKPFARMVAYDGSEEREASLPHWLLEKLFLLSIVAWVASLCELIINVSVIPWSTDSPLSAEFEPVQVGWPTRIFRPSALACDGDSFLLGDSFSLHMSDLANTSQLSLSVLPIADLVASWTALAVTAGSASSSRALILGRSGRDLVEIDFGGQRNRAPRSWLVSPRLVAPLRAVSAASGAFIKPSISCNSFGVMGSATNIDVASDADGTPMAESKSDWALYGLTDIGEVVLLCPDLNQGLLEPVHVIASLVSVYSAPEAATGPDMEQPEFLGVHVDDAGTLFVMLRRFSSVSLAAQTQAEVSVWAADGSFRGSVKLPLGRRWASGLCALSQGGGLLLAAEHQNGFVARPEVWRLRFDVDGKGGKGGT